MRVEINPPAAVMVRAYGSEPVKLYALSVLPRSIEVASVVGRPSIGFPVDDVFQFDKGLFAKLKNAYESGNAEKLKSLWGTAKAYRGAS